MRSTKSILIGVIFTLFLGTNAFASAYLQGAVTANGEAYTNTSAYVNISCNNGYYWASDWDYIDSNGQYSFDTGNNYYGPCGSYYSGVDFTTCEVYAYPAWNETDITLAASDHYSVTLDCSTATAQDIDLNIKDKTIAVSVTAGSNPVTSGISVSCSQQQSPWTYSTVTSATDGVYNVPVIVGSYYCSAWCSDYSNCSYGGYPSTNVTVAESDTVKSASLSFAVKDKTINVSVTAGSATVTSDISVYCSEQESPWTYASTSTATGDVYALQVSAGNYYCSAYCSNWYSCTYSGYPSTTVAVGAGDTSVAASLGFTVKDKSLQVAISAGGETVTSGVTVYASEQGGGWSYSSVDYATSGKYVLAVGAAKYYVSAYCTNWSSCSVAGYPNATVMVEESDTTVDVTLTFLKNNATISGVVTNGSSGVSGASVSIYSYKVGSESGGVAASISKAVSKATITGGQASTTTVSSWASTDSSGAFQVMVPAGTYTVQVYPPWTETGLGSTSIEVTATADATTSLSIILPSKTSVISGTVTDANGEGISGVSISCWSYAGAMGSNDWCWTQTDSSGAYSVNVIEGLKYNISAYYWSSSTSNTICNYTNEGMQTVVAASTPQTINFTYPTCDCAITMNAVDENGDIISSIYGGVNAAPTTLASGEYWYGIWGNLSGGTGTVKVQSDIEYTFSPYIWDSS
ncbi:MAG: hypothetical protein HYY43_03780, partial [Deltaproteobacteria bacterium]|nr:hypothetical protein [Deltaproteobacteria bacterium]